MTADLWETGRNKTEFQKQPSGERTVFKKWQSDIYMQKIEHESKPHILDKNKLKMGHNSKCKMWSYKTFRRNYR